MDVRKKLALALIIMATSVSGLVCSLYIAEQFFFDKLLYWKSDLHGYTHTILSSSSHPLIKMRSYSLLKLMNNTMCRNTQSKSNELFTIAVIGDSMAYGLGLKPYQSYPHQLERELSKHFQVKVYNFSFIGDHVVDSYFKYKLIKEKYKIDLFIIDMVENDLVIDKTGRYAPKEHYESFIAPCRKEKLVEAIDQGNTYISTINDYYYPSFSLSGGKPCLLDKFLSEVDKNDTVVFMSWLSPRSTLEPALAAQNQEYIFQAYTSMVQGHKYQVIQPFSKPGSAWECVSTKECHPASKSQLMVAQYVASWLLNKGLILEK